MSPPRPHAPRTALRLLSFMRGYEETYVLSTELEDEFRIRAEEQGAFRASLWYWAQVIFAAPVYIRRCLCSGGTMMINNLKVTFRQMQKHKSYSAINIAGLAVGMACCLLVLLFVQEELSYDRFHINAERIFRLSEVLHREAGDYPSIRPRSWIAPGLVESFPEVEEAVRIVRGHGMVSSGDKRFDERLFYVDPSFFDVFTFPLRLGDPATVLANPNNVVLSRRLAEKFFGTWDVLGKTLTVDGRHDFLVSGILSDIPANSHLKCDFLAPFSHTQTIYGEDRFTAGRVPAYTYLLLNRPESSLPLEQKFPSFMTSRQGVEAAALRTLSLLPLTDIHLHSHTNLELEKNSRIQYTYVLTAVALIILLIASVNYINLTTARASRRAREVGVRKVVGADRRRLIQQFMGESVTYAFLALILALVLAHFLLPLFNTILDRELTLNFHLHPILYLGFLGLALVVGTAAGGYPAFLLASFQPAQIVKGKTARTGLAGLFMRKGLVVFQFTTALIFIIGMLAVGRQMEFIRNKDLGFDRERVLVLPPPLRLDMGYEGFKAELMKDPAILEVTASTGNPGSYAGIPFTFKSAEEAGMEPVRLEYTSVDFDYFRFFGMQTLHGRTFSASIPSDLEKALVLNESAVKKLGWDAPLGRTLAEVGGEMEGRVIGVVKDYHNVSLHEQIQPAVFNVQPLMFGQVAVRIAPGRTEAALSYLKERWAEWAPFNIFYYSYLDEDLGDMYSEDRKVGLVFRIASALSVLIACLGLLGLTVHIAEQRTKEIGIRKTLGASTAGIVKLLCRDFVIPVLLANVFAWPVVYYVMSRWLRNFAYHAPQSAWIFILGGGIALALSMATVGFQSAKAASADPVKTLRYE